MVLFKSLYNCCIAGISLSYFTVSWIRLNQALTNDGCGQHNNIKTTHINECLNDTSQIIGHMLVLVTWGVYSSVKLCYDIIVDVTIAVKIRVQRN
jgi:hypothetical protein